MVHHMNEEEGFLLWSAGESEVDLPDGDFDMVDSPTEALLRLLPSYLLGLFHGFSIRAGTTPEKMIYSLVDAPIYLHRVLPSNLTPPYCSDDGVSSQSVVGMLQVVDYCDLSEEVTWFQFQFEDLNTEIPSGANGARLSVYLHNPKYEGAAVVVACVSIGETHLKPILPLEDKIWLINAMVDEIAISPPVNSWVAPSERFVLIDMRRIDTEFSRCTLESMGDEPCVTRAHLKRLFRSTLEDNEGFWLDSFQPNYVVLGVRRIR